MATLSEMMQGFSSRLGTAFDDPMTQLGLQMLMASGNMEGNPSFGARFGQAGQGFMQQRAQAQERQQQELLRKIQMGQLARQMQQQESEAKSRQLVQEKVKNDPNLLANYPLARTVLEATGDYSNLGDLAKVGQPAQPRMPYTYEQNLPTGEKVQNVWDPATGQYKAGAPYRPTQQQIVDMRGQQFGETMDWRDRKLEQDKQLAEAGQDIRQQDAATRATAEMRKSENAVRERKIEATKLASQYRVADQRFGDVESRIETLINHPGLRGNYGVYGKLANLPGGDASNARALLEELKETLSFSELNQLKQMGVNLAPVTEAERDAAGKSVANLGEMQSYEGVVSQLNKAREVVRRSRAEAGTLYNQLAPLYQQPQGQQPGAQGGDFKRDMQDAQRALQARPDMRDEINRRLMQKHGRGL